MDDDEKHRERAALEKLLLEGLASQLAPMTPDDWRQVRDVALKPTRKPGGKPSS